MSAATIRYRLEYAVYFVVTRGLRLLPHGVVGPLGAAIGKLAFNVPGRRHRLIVENLRHAFPDWSQRQVRQTGRACLAHWGRMFLESVSLTRFDPDRLQSLFEVEGLEHLEAAQEEGRGVIVSSGHFGAFEIASYGLGPWLGTVHVLVRPQSNPWINRDATRIRMRSGNELVPRRRAAHRMLNILRSGGNLGVAIDQRVRPSEGALIPFLGRPAWTGTIIAILSTRTGIPVVPFHALPLPGGRYRIEFEPPIYPPGRADQNEVELTRRYTESIERAIRAHPAQWFWMHERWLRSPRHRWKASIARLRKESGLPERRDTGQPPSSLAEAVEERHLEEGTDFLLDDGSFEERTAAAVDLGHDLIDRGHPLRFVDLRELVHCLEPLDEGLESKLRAFDRYDLLVVDFCGPADARGLEVEGPDASLVHKLLDHRHGRRSTLAVAPGSGDSAGPPHVEVGDCAELLERSTQAADST